MPTCYYCHKEFEAQDALMPFGPNCSMVCCPCANATPERRQETESRMLEFIRDAVQKALGGSGIKAVVLGGSPQVATRTVIFPGPSKVQ